MVIYHPPTATDYVNKVEIGLKMASSVVHGRGRDVYDQSFKALNPQSQISNVIMPNYEIENWYFLTIMTSCQRIAFRINI